MSPISLVIPDQSVRKSTKSFDVNLFVLFTDSLIRLYSHIDVNISVSLRTICSR
jgi:hypothetical protein